MWSLYWSAFWKLVYWAAPPREWFNSPRYDKFLMVVHYYGGLNLRNIFMKALYGADPADAPPLPAKAANGAPPGKPPEPPAAPRN